MCICVGWIPWTKKFPKYILLQYSKIWNWKCSFLIFKITFPREWGLHSSALIKKIKKSLCRLLGDLWQVSQRNALGSSRMYCSEVGVLPGGNNHQSKHLGFFKPVFAFSLYLLWFWAIDLLGMPPSQGKRVEECLGWEELWLVIGLPWFTKGWYLYK